ncbi:MAG TPA: ABC transporter permease [Acidimicrobiia bacterium]|jgi:ABC-2 type transport system permease protein/oleandomycin transport system permease protein
MTAATTTGGFVAPATNRAHAISDAITIAWRNVINMRRNPQLLVFATVQPVIFVLIFRYVFGGAILVPPGYGSYVNYLMPGIFVQTVVFGSMQTGVGLADDLQKGLVDRFRSLPMARSAVLVGRTLADLLRNVFVVILMAVVGYLVGWRPQTNALEITAGLALVVAFSYSLSWIFAIVGMSARDSETAQAISFPIIAPLVFLSSAFVPTSTIHPSWLGTFAEHQPVSVVVDAVRSLLSGVGDPLPKCVGAIVWLAVIIALCAPLAVARYRRAV